MNEVPGKIATSNSADVWFNGLLVDMFRLMHYFEQDNFDSVQYRGMPPNTFFYQNHAAYFALLAKNHSRFYQARQLLCDSSQRHSLIQLVPFRLLGDLHVRLPFNTAEATNYHQITDT